MKRIEVLTAKQIERAISAWYFIRGENVDIKIEHISMNRSGQDLEMDVELTPKQFPPVSREPVEGDMC